MRREDNETKGKNENMDKNIFEKDETARNI